MSEFGVFFMLHGDKHAAVLATSVWSLRQHYAGPVAIAAGDEAGVRYAELIARDERAGPLTVVPWKFQGGPRGSAYHAKTFMFDLSPFERTVFLDADTIVVGNFVEGHGLYPDGEAVKVTQFADWVTSGKRMRGRILPWKDVAPIEVARQAYNPHPAINTGVLAFSRASAPFHKAWREMSARRLGFICDEIACQLMYADYPHEVLSDAYNWSPTYGKTPRAEVKIIHCHGQGKHVKNPSHAKEWTPVFADAYKADFAGLRSWAPAGDRHLRSWMEGRDL